MRVGVTGFGSVWRRRFGKEPGDPERFRRAAYFNTTGVMANDRVVRHRKIAGHARFNAESGFNPYYPQRAVSCVFECDEPCVWNGQNKVFFERRVDPMPMPDCFLVVLKSAEFGHMDVGAAGWKSKESFLISFSEWQDAQECMLLMPPDGWVYTDIGRVTLHPDVTRPWVRTVRLVE